MKAGRKAQDLTPKETEIMKMLWNRGPMFVREIVECYPEPRPHFNTVATTVRILEDKGYVEHEVVGGSHRFRAIASLNGVRRRKLREVIGNFFNNSYSSMVSSLIEDEHISVDELKELIDMVEKHRKENKEG